MANYKSGIITKRDDSTQQIDRSEQSVLRTAIAQVTLAGAVSVGEIIFLAEVPVDARITSIRVWADDLGTTGDLDLGFYKGTADTDTVLAAAAVDQNAIGTAIDVNAAALANVEVRFETKDLNTAAQKAWELAGLSARPDYNTFLLAFTATEATTAAGDVSVIVEYIA